MLSESVRNKAELSFANMDNWLSTWNSRGGVNGFIVHQHNDKMDSMIPDCLTQSSMIMAYLNAYKKTGEKEWIDKANSLGEYLSSIYIPELHVFTSSSFEHKPKGDTLVYDGFSAFSLLRLYGVTKNKKYLDIAEDSLKKLVIERYWDEKAGCFWNMFKNGKHIHALNMGGVVIAAIVEYTRVTKDESLIDYAKKQADFIMQYQEKNGFLKGAYYYDDAGSWKRIMSLYISWTLRGMIELYDYTRDERYLESIKKALDFLYNKMLDRETMLFYHRFMIRKTGAVQLRKGPEWVAAAGASIYCLARAREFGLEYDIDSILDKYLDYQYPTGGFPNARYYENMFVPHIINNKNGEVSWRDAVPIVGWNSQIFEALSVIADNYEVSADVKYPLNYDCDDGYKFEESEDTFKIIFGPDILAYYYKKNPVVFYNRMTLADSAFCQKNMVLKSMKFRMKICYAVILFMVYLFTVAYLLS